MTRFLPIFLVVVTLFSCKKETAYIPREINSITIQEFKRDSSSIRAIYGVNPDTLYYAGSKGDLVTTINGGKTWNTIKIKYQDSILPHFRSIAYSKNGLFTLSVGNPALLYNINVFETRIAYKEEHEKVFYDSMKFFNDELHGIAVGDPTEDCPSILITIDGGTIWKKLPCEALPKFEEGEAFFAASNTNIAIVDSTVWIASGGKRARILKSTDYGNTWKIFDTPFIQGTGPQGMYSIDFYDVNNGIAVGGNYSEPEDNCANKAITADGGKTWTIVADNETPNYKSCVQYVPDTNGKEIFAVGKTGISFSNDGGLTWKDVSKEGYYSIQFVNKNIAWLSGHEKIGKLIIP
ncbi:Oxidoreductase [Tenacibaculum sp. 190130A14a]|uniref:Oxidoreductase n=1 Tax=Tenacibaculum polynesiense TaxID=3137857 RepID=A0ABP1EU88_9FLAO